MRSDERHKLKSNELAQSLSEIPQYLREHGKKWITGLVIVLLVVVALMMFRSSRLAAQENNSLVLQSMVAKSKDIQRQAARKAQSGEQTDDIMAERYVDSAQPLINSLSDLGLDSSGSGVARTALLHRARLLRSQLFYSSTVLGPQKKQDLLNQIEAIYHTVLQDYPNDTTVLGVAEIGLALVAEDRLQWDQARQRYQAILDDTSGRWKGTIFPSQADQRLAVIADMETESEIVFEWASDVPDVDLTQAQSLSVDSDDAVVLDVQ